MNYEQKYKEALARAKKWYFAPNSDKMPTYANRVIEEIFPELKESEDEKIREEMLQIAKESEDSFYMVLTPNKRETLIAWLEKQAEQTDIANKEYWRGYREGKQEILNKYAELEKQGKQKSVEWCSEDGQNLNVCLGYIPDEFLKRWLKDIIHIKYDKPIDKVESKFHEGDFIKHNKANLICKVISVNSGSYYVENIETSSRVELFNAEQDFHLWTIKDAKDGDVLAVDWYQGDDSWEKIIIFKKYHNKGIEGLINTPCVEGYGNTFKNRKMAFDEEVPYYSKTWTDNLHPATKEQRDLLFAKMKESGYEWNADEKVLNKVVRYGNKILY